MAPFLRWGFLGLVVLSLTAAWQWRHIWVKDELSQRAFHQPAKRRGSGCLRKFGNMSVLSSQSAPQLVCFVSSDDDTIPESGCGASQVEKVSLNYLEGPSNCHGKGTVFGQPWMNRMVITPRGRVGREPETISHSALPTGPDDWGSPHAGFLDSFRPRQRSTDFSFLFPDRRPAMGPLQRHVSSRSKHVSLRSIMERQLHQLSCDSGPTDADFSDSHSNSSCRIGDCL